MPVRWAYLKRVLAGAIFGLYMAHLLYFLNPQIDVTPWRLASVTLIYGAISGLVFGTALWLLRAIRVRIFGRPSGDEYRTHGFGFVPLAAFLAAAFYWTHLQPDVRIYLPVNAVRLLSKATNLITGVAFALLILWFFERNANRRTSRIIFVTGVVLIAVSSFSLYARRESYRTERQGAVVADVGTIAGKRPVIFVAIRNLPYDWIVTVAGERQLPFFEAARRKAYFTRLEPFATSSPDSLWATLATGKLPYRHGVTGRYSYRTPINGPEAGDRFLLVPGGVGFETLGRIPPVQRIRAQLPAGEALPIWSMFERLSFPASVVNWPRAETTKPTRLVSSMMIRTSPRIALGNAAERFNAAGAARSRVLYGLACDALAIETIGKQSGGEQLELEAVALDGFSEAQRAVHIWSNEIPAHATTKGDVARAYIEQLDRLLGDLARRFPGHLLVVVSPSGPAPPSLPDTPYFVAQQLIAGGDPGADDGFVLVAGTGTAHRPEPAPANAQDVVPTILFAAGLPAGRDMDGRVLTDAFSDEFLRSNPRTLIATYEASEITVRGRR